MLTGESFRAKPLEVGDKLLALGKDPALGQDPRPNPALDAFDERAVLGADLVVEGDQLVDPLLVDLRGEEVVEEASGPLRAEREHRPAREIRMAGEDVEPEVGPEEVELAPWDLAAV